jgi:hypothetical protein
MATCPVTPLGMLQGTRNQRVRWHRQWRYSFYMRRPSLTIAIIALFCAVWLALSCSSPVHIWRLDSEIYVWHNRQRCQSARAYRSPDFNFLLVKVPEANRIFLVDLEQRYVGLPHMAPICCFVTRPR